MPCKAQGLACLSTHRSQLGVVSRLFRVSAFASSGDMMLAYTSLSHKPGEETLFVVNPLISALAAIYVFALITGTTTQGQGR